MNKLNKEQKEAVKKLVNKLSSEFERKIAKKAILKALDESINRGYGGYDNTEATAMVGNWYAVARHYAPEIQLYYFIGEV